MEPLVQRLIEEEKVTIQRHEVWHSEEGAKLLDEYDKNLCGGIPFFYNTETKGYICGEESYEELRAWALGSNAKEQVKE